MLNKLINCIQKPELYAPITKTYQNLWDDEHISKGMLESHLDPNNNGATNNHDYVAKSVNWIIEIASPLRYKKLLDLGSGAGIYAEKFAQSGYQVTGIDFSKRSVAYAKEQTILKDSNIEYHCQNYLAINYIEQFDVITMINKDYAVLSITDRMALLGKIYQALKPGGKFIFDVLTPRMRKPENQSWYYENGGFFNEKPYICLNSVYQYNDEDETELHRHIVLTDENVYHYDVYNHYFTKKKLSTEVSQAGFVNCEFYGDIAGAEYSKDNETICIVITK